MVRRTPLLRQPSLYIGLIVGIILAVLIGLLVTVLANSRTPVPKAGTTTSGAGIATLTLDQHAVNLAIQSAVKQVQPHLPFAVTSVSTTLRAGDVVDVNATGQPIFGLTPTAVIALSPAVTSSGSLEFGVQQITVSGLDVSIDNSVNQAIEQAINQQFAGYGHGNLAEGLHYQLVDVSTTPTSLILTAELTSP